VLGGRRRSVVALRSVIILTLEFRITAALGSCCMVCHRTDDRCKACAHKPSERAKRRLPALAARHR